ncbi:hypothetical protein [Virgibacillus sp. YIM 98842]|uniref:hypothetical protein n=1 Tax=Virgibacillus sp. YIM 98842 TaxID=2663533 RepID=UPI0013D96740|nr:hypothetical protein [Virgibacillus sp. YIM 98842]
MAELSRFFNSVEGDERTYQANDFAQFFSNFLGNGFFEGLAVSTENTMNTIVAPGSAFIEGHEYTNTSSLTLTHAGADASQDRIDRVVLRLDRDIDVRAIQAFVKQGTPGSDPEPPTLTRNDTVYELSLAQVRITAGKSFIEGSQITDERGNHEVCGRVQVARQVGDQINTVDIKTPDAPPGDYAEGIVQFYLSGDANAEIMEQWLDSIGVSPGDYGRSLSNLRAYVHTIGNRTHTGVQTITIFDWSSSNNYEIYGEFKRASNSVNAVIPWGSWSENVLLVEQGSNARGEYKRYSDGTLECMFEDSDVLSVEEGANIHFNSRTFNFPYPFVNRPNIQHFSRRWEGVQWTGVRLLTGDYVELYILSTNSIASGYLGYKATGRWR